jgi:hypothetical protein
MGWEWILWRLAGGVGVDSDGSGLGPVAGCCKYGDEPLGSGSTEFVSYDYFIKYNTDYNMYQFLLLFFHFNAGYFFLHNKKPICSHGKHNGTT